MKLAEMIDQIISANQGAILSEDSKFAERILALEAEMPKWRQQALFITWNGRKPDRLFPSGIGGNRFLGAQNYLSTTLTYDATIQDTGAEYIKFEGEPPVQLAEDANGCVFIGDKLTGQSQSFIPLKTPNDYSVWKDADMISINEVYYNITGNIYKVWGNTQLRSLYLDYLPMNPMNLTSFDPETDEYPMSPDVWDIAKKIAVAELYPESIRPADLITDAAVTTERTVRG